MASPTPRSARHCEAGHTMDPNWDSCPYCDAEKRSKQQTQAGQPQASLRSASPDDRSTKIGPGASAGVRRETKVMPSAPSPAAGAGGQRGEVDTRRIVGVLITYTWRPEGQLFAIREGKNFLGAGKVGSEASEDLCDILIQNDPGLSSEHALILCRHGRYDIIDQKSSNGTFLNRELIPIQGTELPNYAEIQTGSTIWTFIKIMAPEKPEARPVTPPPVTSVVPPEGKPKPTKDPTEVR
jgi:hypothetical protein